MRSKSGNNFDYWCVPPSFQYMYILYFLRDQEWPPATAVANCRSLHYVYHFCRNEALLNHHKVQWKHNFDCHAGFLTKDHQKLHVGPVIHAKIDVSVFFASTHDSKLWLWEARYFSALNNLITHHPATWSGLPCRRTTTQGASRWSVHSRRSRSTGQPLFWGGRHCKILQTPGDWWWWQHLWWRLLGGACWLDSGGYSQPWDLGDSIRAIIKAHQ